MKANKINTAGIFLALAVVALLASVSGCGTPSKQSFRNRPSGSMLDMVFVKGGTFEMGNDADYLIPGLLHRSCPRHKVKLSDFYISKTCVTVGQYRQFVEETGHQMAWKKPDAFPGEELIQYIFDTTGGDWKAVIVDTIDWRHNQFGVRHTEEEMDMPVTNLSWQDCRDFCDWLSKKEGLSYSLPSEAQWYYAAMGGEHSHGYVYAGSNRLEDVGWYKNNSGNRYHPVAQKAPNELGLYDMSGNVFELLEDSFFPFDYIFNPYATYKDPLIVASTKDADQAVCSRGGTATKYASVSDIEARAYFRKATTGAGLGFRVVCNTVPYDTLYCDKLIVATEESRKPILTIK